jgi:hypothetical protein
MSKIREGSFMQLYYDGYVHAENIDDYIEAWHNGNSDVSLPKFLGMSNKQYEHFMLTEEII